MAENTMTSDFTDKPTTQAYFKTISNFVESLRPSKRESKAQISYGIKRKFIWFWAYDKTPDGTLYMMVCLDKKLSDSLFHYVKQSSPNRWNHHIEVKSKSIAESKSLKDLVRAGYEFAGK